ncbi:Rpn family recombination-promoting nuclease/putative transposase [Lysinibacillus sp. fls2-241-R2A-57]|uniref:Rpn family recombination-promoting nuclease/putative transposase n=1 Tax=Lysinibacillus sp. fls2-241-R2A-57 TaxID=3040292 RepID=UPI002556EBD2|nr:Rpn family recombination-promoting nuclease/putative transposase [Lysinibacillus sp. fls2-241-R2A-57]
MSENALRRIPLEKFVDLKVDYAFKQLFGNKKNKDLTIFFLNAILNRTGRRAIKEVSFMSQEFSGEHRDDKQSRLDILVKTQENIAINIEIQLSNQHDMIKRTLYYWSKIYTSELKKGFGYHKLRPTITINICNFSLFEQTDAYHTTFHLYEDDRKFRIDDVLEIHFIEMNKFIFIQQKIPTFEDGEMNAEMGLFRGYPNTC